MKIFARIENGVVAEVFRTEQDIAGLFHPALAWVEATGHAVAEGFRHEAGRFVPPPQEQPAAPRPDPLSDPLAAVLARLAALEARLGGH